MALILEGIVTTRDENGRVNISPMGPQVTPAMDQLVLRPYQSSRTYRNLRRTGQGVLHVTDDVELLARSAVGDVDPLPALAEAAEVDVPALADACRWYEFRVTDLDDSQDRTTIHCTVVRRHFVREFFGFNRAKHAVLEAAILATRLEFLPAAQILEEFGRLETIVRKTAGEQEMRAFEFLQQYIDAGTR